MSALPFPDPPLRDGVVALRAWRDEDAAVTIGWAQDPDVLRWAGLPEDYTESVARDLQRVQALVHPDNPRSAEVLERLGFRREGLLRAYRAAPGGREDRVLYAKLTSG